jgi:hypothetical protein
MEQARAQFASPPASARPQVWWHWVNGSITKEGIKADLEAMKKAGVGGGHIFDVGLFDAYNRGQSITPPAGPVKYNSPEWRDLVVFAAKEADRLGLELGIHNSCGWSSSGGPWVQHEDGQKMVVWTDLKLEGPSRFKDKLPRADLEHDIAILAYPTPKAEWGTGSTDPQKMPPRLDGWMYGLGGPPGNYGFGQTNAPVIPKADLIDLTSRVGAEGSLEWDVPAGHWTIVRIGYKIVGAGNRAATVSGGGLEVDKLSSESFDRFFDGGLQPLIDQLGPLAGKSFTTAVIDSYEIWYENWRVGMRDEFQKRRGYDPTPYLATLAGLVVEDQETTERFLFDYRHTIADLFADNYSRRMAERLRQNGLALAIEPYGLGNYNCFTYGKPASMIMGEFWYREKQANVSVKIASSVAHVYGKPVIGAESLTSNPEDVLDGHPFEFKPYSDRAFVLGINRVNFHCYPHQPWPSSVLPGMMMGPFGALMGRTQTWWGMSTEWHTYIARCQTLLQAGQFVADVSLFVGEHDPITWQNSFGSLVPTIPAGYDFDYSGPDVLKDMMAQGGRLVLPSGMSYKVLVLPNTDRMSLALARKIRSLVEDGAIVVGPRPARSPSLADMGKGDQEVARIADEVWGDCDGKTVTEHAFGKGRVVWGKPLETVLAEAKLAPDFQSDSYVTHAIHRRLGSTDVYFVSSSRAIPTDCTCTFRVQGKRPELWHPDSGVIEPAPMWRTVKDGVQVPLSLDPSGSVFVVFRQPSKGADPIVTLEWPEAKPTPPPPSIIKAEYGVLEREDKTFDVTRTVAGAVQGYTLWARADRDLLGDPAVGEAKTLRLTYEDRGKQQAAILRDGESMTIGTGPAPVQVPPACELRIRGSLTELSAWQPGSYRLQTASGRKAVVNVGKLPAPVGIGGPWKVHFPPGWDAPTSTTFDRLISWTQRPEFGIKYFSGTATYVKQFSVARGLKGRSRRLVLDLGVVRELAQVKLNGKTIGVLWKPPFRLDVTDVVKTGTNVLEVKVCNLWNNRLLGDEQLPDDMGWTGRDENDGGTLKAWPEWFLKGQPRPEPRRKTFTIWNHVNKNTRLIDSGLLGPVVLRPVQIIPVNIARR